MRARAVVTSALGLAVFVSACASDAEESAPTDEAAGEVVAHNTLTDAEREAGWVLLFDGETTDGWRGYGGDDVPVRGWTAENGELVGQASGGGMDGGDIVTVAAFTDFDLVFDFKVGTGGNSGVFYRVQEHDGAGLWQVAAEYQVLDDPFYIETGSGPKHLTGENYDLHATEDKTMHPAGEWNTGRIVVQGNRVQHFLNGRPTVEFEMYTDEWEGLVAASKFGVEEHYARAATGSIGLQDHGTPVWFRNMKIRPLDGAH